MKTSIPRITASEITPEEVYLDRRHLLAAGVATAALGGLGLSRASAATPELAALKAGRNTAMSITDAPNSYEDITTYNNYYEFGTDKSDPAVMARDFKPAPWSVTVDGETEVKGKFTLEDILKPHALEERVYRLRCVGSMVHGHPVDGLSPGCPAAAFQAHFESKVRGIHHA